uniref:Ribosomal protein S14 n=1 Tax=Romanomermis culicivorax TaxID=13658 RepID=A0A915JN04_ROMCU
MKNSRTKDVVGLIHRTENQNNCKEKFSIKKNHGLQCSVLLRRDNDAVSAKILHALAYQGITKLRKLSKRFRKERKRPYHIMASVNNLTPNLNIVKFSALQISMCLIRQGVNGVCYYIWRGSDSLGPQSSRSIARAKTGCPRHRQPWYLAPAGA